MRGLTQKSSRSSNILTRQVSHCNFPAVFVGEVAQVRLDCGKRIAGDLRVGLGNGLQQGALAGIGKPDQANVSEKFEVESHKATLTFSSDPVIGWAATLAAEGCCQL